VVLHDFGVEIRAEITEKNVLFISLEGRGGGRDA